jgi:hypothetical protein
VSSSSFDTIKRPVKGKYYCIQENSGTRGRVLRAGLLFNEKYSGPEYKYSTSIILAKQGKERNGPRSEKRGDGSCLLHATLCTLALAKDRQSVFSQLSKKE